MTLPQLDADLFITDGGLETTLVFHHGIDLPDFAAFPLLETDEGRAALTAYYEPYFAIAERFGVGMIVDTPTWRANVDWGARLGYDAQQIAEINRRSVAFVTALAEGHKSVAAVIDGVISPRGDGYVVGALMSADEAASYHALQAGAFADAGAAMLTAITMTYAEEAMGITRAAAAAGIPAVISFTVETDGRLPSGESLADAIARVDGATGTGPEYFMVNCAHPTHFIGALESGSAWLGRIKAVRVNASRLSHAELDAATELDRGDIAELAALHVSLSDVLPDLHVVGGCCGTDHEHVEAFAGSLRGTTTSG